MLADKGKISLRDIAKELGKEGQRISLHDEDVLKLAGKHQGERVIIPNDFHGKQMESGLDFPYSVSVKSYGQVYSYNLKLPFQNTYLKSIVIYSNHANFVFQHELSVEKIQVHLKSGETFVLQKDPDFKTTFASNNIKMDIRIYSGQTIYFRLETL